MGSAAAAEPQSPDAAPVDRDTVAFKLGISFNALGRPADGPGEPTLLAGSAFTGVGFVVGGSYELARVMPLLSLESGLFYGHSTASGFEIRGEQEREVLLEVDAVRVPLWLRVEWPALPALRLVVGGGPEVLFGVASASTVREKNIPEDQAAALLTRAVTSVQLTGIVGVEIDAGPVVIPLSFHASVNPLTGETTAERTEGGQGGQLGPFQVEFDFELMGMLGVGFEL